MWFNCLLIQLLCVREFISLNELIKIVGIGIDLKNNSYKLEDYHTVESVLWASEYRARTSISY